MGNAGGAAAHEAARPRRDRAGRLRARLPRHSVAVGVLRGEARSAGLSRLAALRADSRQKQRSCGDGADAGAQHTAIPMGEEPSAAQSATGAADFSAGGGGGGDRLGGT